MIIAADILDFLFLFLPIASLTDFAFKIGLAYGRSKGGPFLFVGAALLTFSYLFKIYFDIVFGNVDAFWLFLLTLGATVGLFLALVGTNQIHSFLLSIQPDQRREVTKATRVIEFVAVIFLIVLVPYFLGYDRPIYWKLGAAFYIVRQATLFGIVVIAGEFFRLFGKPQVKWKTRLLRVIAIYYLAEPVIWLAAAGVGGAAALNPGVRLAVNSFGALISVGVGILVFRLANRYVPSILRQVKTTYIDTLRVRVLRDLYLIGAGLTIFVFIILLAAESLYGDLRISTLESYAESRVAIGNLAVAKVRSELQDVVLRLQRSEDVVDSRSVFWNLKNSRDYVEADGDADSKKEIGIYFGPDQAGTDTLISQVLDRGSELEADNDVEIATVSRGLDLKYLIIVRARNRYRNNTFAFALIDVRKLISKSISDLGGYGAHLRLISPGLKIIFSSKHNEIGGNFSDAVLRENEIDGSELARGLSSLSKSNFEGYRILKGQTRSGMGEYYLLIATPLEVQGYKGVFASIQPEERVSRLFRPTNSLLILAALLVAGLFGGGLVVISVAFKWSMKLEKEVQNKVVELRSSEDKYRRIVENPYVGSFIMMDNRLIFANSRLAEILETSVDRLSGSDLSVFMDGKDHGIILNAFTSILKGEKNGDRWEVDAITATGRHLTLSGYSSPIHIGNKVGVQSVVVDSTSEFREKEKLEQFERLESMATLAAGIAHDFNNILQVVLGSSQLLQRGLADSGLKKYADNITNVALRGSDLSKRLLTFSRQKGLEQRRVFDINSIIVESLPLFEETFPRTIKIETELNPSPIYVDGDQSQIQQVIFNLSVNARDAMPHGGTLLIKTEVREVSPMEADVYQTAPGPYAFIMIRDNGEGIPPELMNKVFEPFFTTKPPGKGTGLGLSVVYGIVRSHNGFLKVYSEVRKGTVFSIYLPSTVAAAPQATEAVPTRGAEAIPTYGSRILFVDDEAGIREAAEFLLEQAGYRVTTASNGITAIEIYRKEWEKISLVVLDLNMPELSGREVLENLTIINPDVRVLISTGYITPDERAGLKGIVEVIEKPFDFDQLVQKVRGALQNSPRVGG